MKENEITCTFLNGCAGAGQGDAHEQQQRHEQALAAGGGHQLLPGLLALVQDLGEYGADVRLGAAPEEDLPGDEVDEGDGQHIAQGADRDGLRAGHAHRHSRRNTAAQLDEGDHRDQKCLNIFFQHITFTFINLIAYRLESAKQKGELLAPSERVSEAQSQ